MKHINLSSIVILLACLVGCATTLKPLTTEYVFQDKSASVAIGRVEFVWDERTPSETAESIVRILGRPTLSVEHTASRNEYAISLDGMRSNFAVELPSGQYRITNWTSGKLKGDPRGLFVVRPGEITYIGTLRFQRGGSAGLFQQGIPGKWLVEDDFANAVKLFRERYPNVSQDPTKSLIQLE